MARQLDLTWRTAIAGALLGIGLAAGIGAASLGEVRLGAGEMNIALGTGESGLTIEVASRTCHRGCGIDLSWTPARPGLQLLN
jgi:hypothetical protein